MSFSVHSSILDSNHCSHSDFDVVLEILLKFIEEGLTSPATVCDRTANQIQAIIAEIDNGNNRGAAIHHIATELMKPKYGGVVPKSREKLLELGLKGMIVPLMMHLFGSTDLVISIHGRKIVTALDMLDWEESGASDKLDIKMEKLPPLWVKKSLMTWLPRAEYVRFFDTMGSLGPLLASQAQGDWGPVKAAINNHFSSNDKPQLTEMVENIRQFYLVTKTGGKQTRSCS